MHIKITPKMAEEFRVKASKLWKCACPLKPNVTKEARTSKEKNDRSMVIFNADKGVEMVVLNKQDNISKAEKLLGKSDTCRT